MDYTSTPGLFPNRKASKAAPKSEGPRQSTLIIIRQIARLYNLFPASQPAIATFVAN